MRILIGYDGSDGADAARIMIGVDGSAEAEHAVREVGMRVWPKGTQVRIIAVDDGTSPKRIARVLPTTATMISNSNDKAFAVSRMMVEWAERELRAIGLQVSVAMEKGDPDFVRTTAVGLCFKDRDCYLDEVGTLTR